MSRGERPLLPSHISTWEIKTGGKKKTQRLDTGDWQAVRTFHFLGMFSVSSVNSSDSRACQ